MKRLITTIALIGALIFAGRLHATLIDRGNGLVYDTVQNISWTKEADISGLNNWQGQIDFAANLVLGSFDDFRLASITDLEDLAGQLAQLVPPLTPLIGNQGPFLNIQRFVWSRSEVFDPLDAWAMDFAKVDSGLAPKDFLLFGWAVRNGDSVPEPGSGLLLGAGLLELWWIRRRQLKT